MQSKSGTARRGRPCKEGSQQQRGGVWGKTLILNPRPTLVVAGGLGGNVGVHAAVVGVLDVQLGALAPPEGGPASARQSTGASRQSPTSR